MTLRTGLLVCVTALLPALGASAESYETDEEWVKAVRGSGSYREGLRKVQDLMDRAYDIGALKGAAHWEGIHEYFISLARKKGCEEGKRHSAGPVETCNEVPKKEPPITAGGYREGLEEVGRIAADTLYPDLVRQVLKPLYDYGYVQGMKHGVRVYNDDIRLTQSYFKACISRASHENGERACAEGSKKWSDAQIERLRERIEAHGLPAGKAR